MATPRRGPGQHLDVVAAVADGDRAVRLDAEPAAEVLQRAGLGDAGGGDVQPRRPAHRIGHAGEADVPDGGVEFLRACSPS